MVYSDRFFEFADYRVVELITAFGRKSIAVYEGNCKRSL